MTNNSLEFGGEGRDAYQRCHSYQKKRSYCFVEEILIHVCSLF